MSYLSRWAVEIIPNEPRWDTHIQAGNIASAPAATDPIFHPKPPIDVTDRLLRDGIGSVNRAAERDLLSFRTGDVTVTLDDRDGFLTDLFSLMTATNRWQFRIFKDGAILFHGMLLGLGSIKFDVKARNCEVTAYGLTKILDDTSAESVARGLFAGLTVTTATAGASTLTMSDTTGLLTGDVLHLTNQVVKEDVTVKQVTSATVVSLEAVLVNTYASGSPVTNTTPYHRYKTIDYLVRALFNVAQIPVAEVRLDSSQFKKLAPTPVNLGGLDFTKYVGAGGISDRLSRVNISVANDSGATGGSYYQSSPDGAWTLEDTTVRPWIDWSRYFVQGGGPPILLARGTIYTGTGTNPWQTGWDFSTSTVAIYYISGSGLAKETTTDGTTYVAVFARALPVAAINNRYAAVEKDGARDGVYCSWNAATDQWQYHDITANVFTDLKQADDAGYSYYAPVYIPELDYTLALRGTSKDGPAFGISAWQGKTRLWVRSFPNVKIALQGTIWIVYPTQTMRYVNGSLYCLAISDGAAQIIRSDDQFLSNVMRKLYDATNDTRIAGARIGDKYWGFTSSGSTARGYFIAAPFYAGVVPYLDLKEKSVAEGLKALSVIANAVFWLDDSGQGHFVARDLFPPNSERDITDDIMERSDTLIWDQTVQFVTVSGGSIAAQVSGDKDFAATGIDLSSALVPNEAFAQALADSYYDFYHRDRKELQVVTKNAGQDIYRPLDRVFINGIRYLVYEADHDIAQDGVTMTVLEDA